VKNDFVVYDFNVSEVGHTLQMCASGAGGVDFATTDSPINLSQNMLHPYVLDLK
jgi:hypothetical protein